MDNKPQTREDIHELIFLSTGYVKKMMSRFPDLTCSCIHKGLYPARAGAVQPGEETAPGAFYQRVQIPEGRVQRGQSLALFMGAQRQDQRQWVPTGTREVLSAPQETLFPSAGDRALAQVAREGLRVSHLGDTRTPSGRGLGSWL